MPIRIDTLRSAAARPKAVVPRTLHEARASGAKTAFLCHSHRDTTLAQGLVQLLAEEGWRVYIDWLDADMPETPNRETAQRIKQKIIDLEYFLFLATPNSMSSRWCPWEIGYADGKKHIDNILVIPTTDGSGTYGNEYLQLYRRVDIADAGNLAVWRPGQTNNGVLVMNL
jgi:hypothetical protein